MLQANRDQLDLLGNEDLMDQLVRRVILELLANQVVQDQLVQLVSLVSQVHRGIEVTQASTARSARLDSQAPVATQEVPAIKVRRVTPAHLVLLDPKELPDQQDLSVRKEAEVVRVIAVAQDPLVQLVQRDSVVLQDRLVHRDHRVPLEMLGQRARRDLLGRLAHQARQAI